MADFNWDKFSEKAYEEFKKKLSEVNTKAKNGERALGNPYIGSIHVGEVCVDINLSYADEIREDSKPQKVIPLFDCDMYVANVDTGYGYSNLNGTPYDYVGGTGFKDIPCMEFENYQDFKRVISEVLTDMIKLYVKYYSDKDLVEAMENPYVDF